MDHEATGVCAGKIKKCMKENKTELDLILNALSKRLKNELKAKEMENLFKLKINLDETYKYCEENCNISDYLPCINLSVIDDKYHLDNLINDDCIIIKAEYVQDIWHLIGNYLKIKNEGLDYVLDMPDGMAKDSLLFSYFRYFGGNTFIYILHDKPLMPDVRNEMCNTPFGFIEYEKNSFHITRSANLNYLLDNRITCPDVIKRDYREYINPPVKLSIDPIEIIINGNKKSYLEISNTYFDCVNEMNENFVKNYLKKINKFRYSAKKNKKKSICKKSRFSNDCKLKLNLNNLVYLENEKNLFGGTDFGLVGFSNEIYFDKEKISKGECGLYFHEYHMLIKKELGEII